MFTVKRFMLQKFRSMAMGGNALFTYVRGIVGVI